MILLSLWNVVSFGKRYLMASLLYVGLGLIVGSTIPYAASGDDEPMPPCEETSCPDGQWCCNNTCISIDWDCCDSPGDPYMIESPCDGQCCYAKGGDTPTCVPANYLCCDDGTYGDPNSCTCCPIDGSGTTSIVCDTEP